LAVGIVIGKHVEELVGDVVGAVGQEFAKPAAFS